MDPKPNNPIEINYWAWFIIRLCLWAPGLTAIVMLALNIIYGATEVPYSLAVCAGLGVACMWGDGLIGFLARPTVSNRLMLYFLTIVAGLFSLFASIVAIGDTIAKVAA